MQRLAGKIKLRFKYFGNIALLKHNNDKLQQKYIDSKSDL